MAILRTPPLDERIKDIRAEIDTIIDARAEALREESPGVPLTVLRNLLIARAVGWRNLADALPRGLGRPERSGGKRGRGMSYPGLLGFIAEANAIKEQL